MKISRSHRLRAGFSLLELSIVIVIIGLLAGMVVAIQSYLRNAQLNTAVNEGKFYLGAFNQFQTVYSAIPGDFVNGASTWTGAHSGDGNGYVYYGTSNTAEWFYVFEHLANAGLIPGKYTGLPGSAGAIAAVMSSAATDSANGVNVPGTSISSVGYIFSYFTDASGYANGLIGIFDGYYGHVLFLGKVAQVGGNNMPNSPFMTTQEAYMADSKYDDGMPGTGWIRTPNNAALGNCTTGTTIAATYLTSYKGFDACMFYLTQS